MPKDVKTKNLGQESLYHTTYSKVNALLHNTAYSATYVPHLKPLHGLKF